MKTMNEGMTLEFFINALGKTASEDQKMLLSKIKDKKILEDCEIAKLSVYFNNSN